MKIGPLYFGLTRKNASGLEIYPWQALTTDRLSPELKSIVAKMARAAAKDVIEPMADARRADWLLQLERDVMRAEARLRGHLETARNAAEALEAHGEWRTATACSGGCSEAHTYLPGCIHNSEGIEK